MRGLCRPDVAVEEVRTYVRAACEAQDLPLDDAALERVAEVFARNARMASLVTAFELPEERDPAALLRLD
ncbi:MAG: DUF4089 domain-containing protein [Betaproteobacteria bacterium]|nr:DUF4089 domain-containing protein [Betaproteobacteria bacterium]MBL8535555.1 DUF4089 domain-containing protein [Betaproteobacteria bacterium]